MLKLLRSLITALTLAAALSPAAYAASTSKAFTVTNTGNGPLTIAGAAISGNPTEFALTGNTCTSVAPGESCVMTVAFTPTASGPRTAAALTYASNGTNGPTHSIPLTGAGGAAGHTYWRVIYIGQTIYGANPGAHGASELEFRAVPGGPDLATGGTAIASSSSSASYVPSKAFDGLYGFNSWFSYSSAVGEWVGYQFAAPVAIHQIWYYPYNFGTILNSPTAIAIEYSDNGTSWTRVREFTGITGWAATIPKTFDF